MAPACEKKKAAAGAAAVERQTGNESLLGAGSGGSAGSAAHALGDDADLLDAGALGCVDDLDDVAVAQVARAHDEHRLVLAFLEDRAETLLEFLDGDVLVVDRDLLVA